MNDSLITPPDSPYLVPFDSSFTVSSAPTESQESLGKKEAKEKLKDCVADLRDLQRRLYADDRFSVLLVFQAMDAAGKDGTIRAVLSGVNPAGCQVFSFKVPSKKELDQDFLWRVHRCAPERGRIGVFNRSHYEEVLVVRVHPEYLAGQRLPPGISLERQWEQRFESIRDFEKHLARNGTLVLKFWLNVSPEEQRRRFLDRIDEARSNWKFSPGDVAERRCWDRYMEAYEAALNETSREHAPWYAIPADNKPFMRLCVAEIVRDALRKLDLSYPELSVEDRSEMLRLRDELDPH